jgi:hypothetical protein
MLIRGANIPRLTTTALKLSLAVALAAGEGGSITISGLDPLTETVGFILVISIL